MNVGKDRYFKSKEESQMFIRICSYADSIAVESCLSDESCYRGSKVSVDVLINGLSAMAIIAF